MAGRAVQGLSVVKQGRGRDMFATYRQPSEDTAGEKRIGSPYKEYSHKQQYLPPWAQVSLLLGHWGCGAGLLWEESQPAGVKWSWVKCLKGTHDPGALIARDRTAGTRQSFPGPQDVPKVLDGS